MSFYTVFSRQQEADQLVASLQKAGAPMCVPGEKLADFPSIENTNRKGVEDIHASDLAKPNLDQIASGGGKRHATVLLAVKRPFAR